MVLIDFNLRAGDKDFLVDHLCKNKRVYHPGFCGDWHLAGDYSRADFCRISKVAKEWLGVDLNPLGVFFFSHRDFNARLGNAETFRSRKKFDVAYACCLIEHLDNVGAFLDSCLANLRIGGNLIITTGNPYSLSVIFRSLFRRADDGILTDHTCWISPKLMQELLKRRGLNFEVVFYYTNIDRRSFWHNVRSRIASLIYFVPGFNEEYMIIVRKKKMRG